MGTKQLHKSGNMNQDGDFTLAWNDLCVTRTNKTSTSFWRRSQYQQVQIINNVSGEIKSGSLMAIMGPSGAGKTTLLTAISMRVQGDSTGFLTLNHKRVSRRFMTGVSGFVPQQDLTFDSLTVEEHMAFMARMKMDRHAPDVLRKKRIFDLLRELGISNCRHSLLKVLSGGERRKVSLAVQLINDPPFLFCDEPTTGLDSWSAASVIVRLQALASSGKAIVCSIHQPASGIFDLFHTVVLLAGGKVAFHGPASDAARFFETVQFSCPIGYNEAEYLVNTISSDEGAKIVCNAWSDNIKRQKNYETSESKNRKMKLTKNESNSSSDENFQHFFSIEKPRTATQFQWLLWRSYMSTRRNSKQWLIEFISYMGISLIIALPYQNVLEKIDQRDIQNIQGLMYLVVTETIFIFIYNVFYSFPSEISIFLREVANNLYTPGPYYLSKIMLMVPRAVIEPLLYASLIFWVTGLSGGILGYIFFIMPVIFSANTANAYGSWLSATFESINTGSLVSVPIELVGYTLSGSFVNLSSLSMLVSWMKYGSIFYYSSEAISIQQWGMINTIECDTRAGLPCIINGAEAIESFGFDSNNYHRDLWCMVAMFIGFHFLGFLSLIRRSRKQPVY